jgi:ABC-type transport system involved in multi-copper enzyme maturation permease subunit
LYVRFVVPMLGAFYGTSLIADEVEDRTITYLFTRPVPKSAVLIGKYAAYLACTVLVVLPSLTVVFFLLIPLREIGPAFSTLATDLALLAAGLAVYGGVFALVGTSARWPLVIGLVFAFGWEQLAMAMSGYVRRFTIVYYLQGLVPHAIPSEGLSSLLAPVIEDSPDVWTCVISLAVALILSLGIAMFAVERREYVLRQ